MCNCGQRYQPTTIMQEGPVGAGSSLGVLPRDHPLAIAERSKQPVAYKSPIQREELVVQSVPNPTAPPVSTEGGDRVSGQESATPTYE